MDVEYFNIDEKPEDWPANAIECQLENIYTQINKFKENPSYKNKEVLISLVSDYDLNQRSMLGLLRTTEYEAVLINSLFLEALLLNLNVLKTYLYELVGHKARMQKMVSWITETDQPLEISEYKKLMLQVKIYYLSYLNFTVDKDKPFADKLIETVKSFLEYSKENDPEDMYFDTVARVTHEYISLLNDISYFRCVKRTRIWAFSRDEIYRLFKLASKLINFNGDSPVVRPLKGVLMTSISNYILKSRNDYNEDYICKYIPSEIAEKSIVNHEIWMSIIENLNDKREQRVVLELFDEKGWKNYSWADGIDFEPKRKYHVSSFCKSLNDTEMQRDYGSCIYGYKDDRMADILSPIIYRYYQDGTKSPFFTQVIAFDIIYDREEAKEEINFLCSILDCFEMNDIDKKRFLEEILQYWILSVKDEKWSHERERRYVLFLYDDYDYQEIDISDPRFLKIKTSLFLLPDFILGENPAKPHIRAMVDEKREAISMKSYLFCDDCLNRDFDIVAGGNTEIIECSICGSKNVSCKAPRTR